MQASEQLPCKHSLPPQTVFRMKRVHQADRVQAQPLEERLAKRARSGNTAKGTFHMPGNIAIWAARVFLLLMAATVSEEVAPLIPSRDKSPVFKRFTGLACSSGS